MVRRRLDFWCRRPPLKQLYQLLNQPEDGIICRSYSSLAMISATSTWMYSESRGWPRRRESESMAFSSLPRLTKYRGESGRNIRPPPRIKPQANWMLMGMR